MHEITALLKEWKWDEHGVRERMYRAPTPRERERWHALWLLARGWSASQVADALKRDPHTIGEWLASLPEAGKLAQPASPLSRRVVPPRPWGRGGSSSNSTLAAG